MTEWVAQREAAVLLGVHKSAVPKMIAWDLLHPRADARPSLSRAEVVELAGTRAAAAGARAAARGAPRGHRPPDDDHVWLPTSAAAAVLGCSVVALRPRANRGRVPPVMHQGWRWLQLDHLELLVRAQAARRASRA